MVYKIPDRYEKLYSNEVIQREVKRLGSEISPWVQKVEEETGAIPLAVCILRGALFFYADLLRAIDHSIEPECVRAWAYSLTDNKKEDKTGVRVSVESVVAENRSILIVDDICDTGSTLARLVRVLNDLGAREVKTAVLIHRVVKNSKFTPDWAAFKYDGPEWFVGYGMDDRNHYRNLQDVYIMRR